MKYTTWTTREGSVLQISSMNESHIRNCIAMLERRIKDINENGGSIEEQLMRSEYRSMIASFQEELNIRAQARHTHSHEAVDEFLEDLVEESEPRISSRSFKIRVNLEVAG